MKFKKFIIKIRKKKISQAFVFVNLRRISQAFFLILFLYLFLNAVYKGNFDNPIEKNIRPSHPIRFFFDIDPLITISSWLATGTIYKGLMFSLIIISITMIMGRFFCGWVCPLGTLNHIIGIVRPSLKSLKRIEVSKLKPSQSIKYYLLIALLISAFFGSLQVGLLDPNSFLWRSLATSFLPAFSFIWQETTSFFYSLNVPYLFILIDYSNHFFYKFAIAGKSAFYHYGWLIGLLFLLVLFLNRRVPRFWCRYICPLGALLGFISKLSIFGLEKRDDKCDDCDICILGCQGAANPKGRAKWVVSECMMCFNCYNDCPQNALKFKFFPKNKGTATEMIDLNRRKVLISLGAGVIFIPLSRASDKIEKNYNPYLIRPPGAVEEKEFLRRCIKCGECMKICPTNALHPCLLEGGIEGIWSPILIPRIGYCENTCVLCGYACPTEAIKELTEEEKLGSNGRGGIKIGLAAIDRGRCLPWALKIPCIVCEEHCPTSPKAIYLEDVVIKGRNGKDIKLKFPYVDPKLCWGCGICEYKCPVKDKPAIYVTNIGESRSNSNQLLL